MLNRTFFFTGLILAAAMILVTAFLIVDRFAQIAAVRKGFWDNLAYTTSQTDFELMRLIDTLNQSADASSDVDPTTLEIRYEVALSRLIGLTEGRTGQRVLTYDMPRDVVQNAITVLEALEPRILRFPDLDAADQNQVVTDLRALSQDFHRSTVAIASLGDTEQTAFYQRLQSNAWTEVALLGLVLFSGTLAFANAIIERRRYLSLNQSLASNVAARTSDLEKSNSQLRNEVEERTRAEARYRALVDLAEDVIVVFDVDAGRFIEANPRAARIYGYSVEELLQDFGPVELSPEFQPDGRRSDQTARAYIEDALQGNFPKFEWIHRDRDGRDIPCEVSLARFPDPKRRLVRASILDVTDRKEAERQRLDLQRQLTQAQKLEAIGQMTGGVAHDFNNLLNVILGNLEMLQDKTTDSDKTELITTAIGATHKGADLTRNMLSFASRAYLQPTRLNLSGIARDLESWIGRTIPAHIRVEKSLQPDLWPVLADQSSTESAILNLMINARDAMPDGGVITLETANVVLDQPPENDHGDDLQPGRYALLAISDTGTGIPSDLLDRVFDPFFTTKGPAGGSGLGLSMVHGFMRQTSGGARIYSEVGIGTTVKLYFPASLESPADTADTGTPTPAPPKVTGRILVAEDQEAVIDLLVRILRAEGHDVVPALSGDQALDLFRNDGPFDLVVTDIVMPGQLQGPDLAREIRRSDPAIPVVFMSGYAREATVHGNGLHETDIRLMKPVSKKVLIQAVQTALAST